MTAIDEFDHADGTDSSASGPDGGADASTAGIGPIVEPLSPTQ